METEKACHDIPSVYDGLDPDAEILLRFNRYKARRHDKSNADKGSRRRCEQQEQVFAVRAQDALAPTPVTEQAAANLAFVTLTIGRAEGQQAELHCMVDSGAQMSLGNMGHMLKLALQRPQAVKSIAESGDPLDADTGITGTFTADSAEGTPFPFTIEWRTPHVRRDKSPVSLTIKCGVDLAERCVIGMPTLGGMCPEILICTTAL